jgi:hypothetical protein
MLACIHSIRHLLSITHSQERTNHVSPLPFITIIHPSTMHCTVPLSMAFVHARITLSWLAHNGMHLHVHRLPTTTLQRDIHIYIHACTEMRTTRMMIMMVMMPLPSSSHPLNLLMSVFGGDEEEGGDGGGSSIRCRCSS